MKNNFQKPNENTKLSLDRAWRCVRVNLAFWLMLFFICLSFSTSVSAQQPTSYFSSISGFWSANLGAIYVGAIYISGITVFVLVGLWVHRAYQKHRKPLIRFKDDTLRWLQEHPVKGPAILTSPLLAVVVLVGLIYPGAVTHLINAVGVAGLIFSTLGFLYTYLQLRDNNARIVGYSEFYRWIEKLLKEIEENKASEFFFYGPTILPGNVAVGDADPDVRQFREDLDDLFSRRLRFNKAAKPVVIVPSIRDYKKSYDPFLNTRMSHFPKEKSQEDWEEFVKKKQKEASDFQRDLPTEFGEKREPRDLHDITTAYLLSNGKRVIYAKPLHYVSARKGPGADQRHNSPHLVGFTSTDSVTIDAFQEHFEKVGIDPGTGLAREQLQLMYSKHIISPRYLDERIRGLHPLTVDTLAAHDHDHFGGKAATDKFCDFLKHAESGPIEPTKPPRAILVLDIGSGFGGPARYIAEKCNCSVDGLELQTDRYEWAVQMTERLNWHDQVQFSNVNACTEIKDMVKKYDYAVAFLSILHFPNKEDFLKVLGERIKIGGKVYIEDYVLGRDDELKEREESDLMRFISCPLLLSLQKYQSFLVEGGLSVTVSEDTTAEWQDIAEKRVVLFEAEKSQHIERSGKDAFDKAQAFHKKVVQLYKAKVIAGRRIIATKT